MNTDRANTGRIESVRTIQNGRFCWQSKALLERIRKQIEDKSSALGVYMALTVVASDNGSEKPFETTHSWLEDLSGFSRTTIKRRLADLERIGAIKVFPPATPGSHCTYQLLTPDHGELPLGHGELPLGHGVGLSVAYSNRRKGIKERERAPTLAEVLKLAELDCVSAAVAKKVFDHYESKNLWFNKHGRLLNVRHTLKVWQEDNRHENNSNTGRQRVDANRGTLNDANHAAYSRAAIKAGIPDGGRPGLGKNAQ